MKKKVILALTAMFVISSGAFAYGLESIPEKRGEVASEGLNMRTGPGTGHGIIKEIYQGEDFDILGAMDEWYLVQLEDKTVGLVYKEYVRVTEIYTEPEMEGDAESSYKGVSDAGILFDLANKARLEGGLKPFQWDERLNEIALLKAKDIEEEGYFGHFSPKYGTPFKMLKNMGIEYNSASENIAGGKNIEKAHDSIMGSPAHRGNILNRRFNKMGVGICESAEYGYIMVQLFVEE